MPQLTPQDLQFLAMMPKPGQTAGGINAFNQAAFGNPVPANSPYGIVPTLPSPSGFGAASQQQQSGQQQGQQGQQQPAQSAQQHLLALLKQQQGVSRQAGPHGATQGGPGVGSTAAKEALSNFERENIAVKPSWSSAIQMGLSTTGAFGMASQLAKQALTEAFHPTGILGDALAGSFNVPGPRLSQFAMDEVSKSFYGALNPTASNINQALAKARSTLDVNRALAGFGSSMQDMTQGMSTAGLAGLFGGFAGAEMIGGSSFGGDRSTGGMGPAGGGGDGSGGMGGGVGRGSGSNRSM